MSPAPSSPKARALDPKNPEVSQHIDDLAILSGTRARRDDRDRHLRAGDSAHPNPGKQSFHLKTSEQEILRRVLDAYGIGMVADDSLGRRPSASMPMTWTLPRPRTW